jgi:hypothetical protein
MTNKHPYLLRLALLLAALFLLIGCNRSTPTPAPAPAVVPPFSREELPPEEAIVQVEHDQGGTIALEDGAQVTLPAGALVADATVTFRTALGAPPAPLPASILGRAYELLVEDSELTGVALLRLPLPPGVTPDQYEIAPYRWTGRVWERVTARDVTGGIQLGVSQPGIVALLGRWRLADATIALVKPDTVPGQASIPLTLVGQYRYSAIPALQDDLVPARVVLKQDSSGGAGLVSGDPSQDITVDEATLFFKPDPSRSQGLIEFSHVFELTPGLLDLDPGVNTRFYVVLTVEDSAAPTRRVSSGVEYTQILPIRVENMKVVRPVVLEEDRIRLRWKVLLNGLTFQTPESRTVTLDLQPIIDQGGVGDYRIVLEVAYEGDWRPISNEVSIQLALRATATLPPGVQPTPTTALVAIVTPGPPIQPPTVPTRRPTPSTSGGGAGAATPSPTVTEAAAVTPTPTRPAWANVFWADQYIVAPGGCTNLHWKVEGVITVLFDGQPATGEETRQVCPTQTTTYTLSVTSSAGQQNRTVTIQVATSGQPAIAFTADRMQVSPGGCTTLSWSAVNVKEVRLNGQGVAGVASQQVCLEQTANFELVVITSDDQTITKRLTITVTQAPISDLDAAFWAEQYTLNPGNCTTLHWRVENVKSVVLDTEGVPGIGARQVCPEEVQFYTLEITDLTDMMTIKEVALRATDPAMNPDEIVAQGEVSEVISKSDVSPNEQGDQPGFEVTVVGLNVLFVGGPGSIVGSAVVSVPQSVIDLGENSALHWPVRPGQLVEFRATCNGNACYFDYTSDAYLYWRSE